MKDASCLTLEPPPELMPLLVLVSDSLISDDTDTHSKVDRFVDREGAGVFRPDQCLLNLVTVKCPCRDGERLRCIRNERAGIADVLGNVGDLIVLGKVRDPCSYQRRLQ